MQRAPGHYQPPLQGDPDDQQNIEASRDRADTEQEHQEPEPPFQLFKPTDTIFIKILKVTLLTIVIPFVLLYHLLKALYKGCVILCKCISRWCEKFCNWLSDCCSYLCEKLGNCCEAVCEAILNCCEAICSAMCRCCRAICNAMIYCCKKIYRVTAYCCSKLYACIKVLGIWSLAVIRCISIMSLRGGYYMNYFNALLFELTQSIMIPMNLGCLLPTYQFCYKYIWLGVKAFFVKFLFRIVLLNLFRFIKFLALKVFQFLVFLAEEMLKFLREFYLLIGVPILIGFNFFFFTFLYQTVLVNTCRGIRYACIKLWKGFKYAMRQIYKCIFTVTMFIFDWVLMPFFRFLLFCAKTVYKALVTICRAANRCAAWLCYDIIYKSFLVPLWSCTRYIFVEVIYKAILLNIWRAINWFTVEIVYKALLLNFWRAIRWFTVEIIYKAVLIIIWRGVRWFAVSVIYDKILVPIARVVKLVAKKIYSGLSQASKWVWHRVLVPIGRMFSQMATYINQKILQPFGRAIKAAASFVATSVSEAWAWVKRALSRGNNNQRRRS